MGAGLKNGTNSTISVDVRSIKVRQDTSRQQRHKRKRRRHYILLSYTFILSSADKYKTFLFLLAGHIRTECKCTVGTDLHWKQEEATGQTDMPRVRIIGCTYRIRRNYRTVRLRNYGPKKTPQLPNPPPSTMTYRYLGNTTQHY